LLQHPLAHFDAQDLEYFENFTGIMLNTTKEVEPDLPMCSFREFQVYNQNWSSQYYPLSSSRPINLL
jgi:hypothetical protein